MISMDGENTPRFEDAFGGPEDIVKDLRDSDNYSKYLRSLTEWKASFAEELVRALEIKEQVEQFQQKLEEKKPLKVRKTSSSKRLYDSTSTVPTVNQRKTVVIELDELLFKITNEVVQNEPYNLVFEDTGDDSDSPSYVYFHTMYYQFLEQLSQKFDLILYS